MTAGTAVLIFSARSDKKILFCDCLSHANTIATAVRNPREDNTEFTIFLFKLKFIFRLIHPSDFLDILFNAVKYMTKFFATVCDNMLISPLSEVIYKDI